MGKKPKQSLTPDAFTKAINDIDVSYGKKPNKLFMSPTEHDLFKGAFTGSSVIDNGKRKILTPMDHVSMGRLAHFVNMVSIDTDQSSVQIPTLTKSTSEDYTEETFTALEFGMSEHKVHGTSAEHADSILYGILTESTLHLPTIVSPETSVLERVVIALEALNASGQPPSKSALVLGSKEYDDLVIETGGGVEASKYWGNSLVQDPLVGRMHRGRNTFLGVPMIDVPSKVPMDIIVVNPQVASVFVRQEEQAGAKMRAGGGLLPDAIVISSDQNAHIVSKHFDEDTNDWCIDCWTCGYSHWAYEESDADELLSSHAGEDTRIFYRR